MDLVVRLGQSDANSIAEDPRFKAEVRRALGDALNEVKIRGTAEDPKGVQVDALAVMPQPDQSLQTDSFWIAFRVQGENETLVRYYLSEAQAITKAKFASSLEKRMLEPENGQVSIEVSQMTLAPPRLALEYLQELEQIIATQEDPGFFERLFQADQSDTVTVMLGGLSGILLGLILFFCLLHYSRRFRSRSSEERPLAADPYSPSGSGGGRPSYDDQDDYDYGDYDPNAGNYGHYDPAYYGQDPQHYGQQPYPGYGQEEFGGGLGGDDMPNWDAGDDGQYDGDYPQQYYPDDHAQYYPDPQGQYDQYGEDYDHQDYGQDGGYGQQSYEQQGQHSGQYGGAYGDEEEEYEY
jgi:hypothetical protein